MAAAPNFRQPRSNSGDLTKLLHSLSMKPVDPPAIVINAADFSSETEACQASLLGRFCAEQDIQIWHLQPALSKAWRTTAFTVTRLRTNLFQFFFSNRDERAWVLEHGSWACDDTLLAVLPWSRNLCTGGAGDWTVPFWVHLRGLPYECVSPAVGKRLVEFFPEWEKGQIQEFSDTSERFFRLRVFIDVDDALPRGFPVSLPFYGSTLVTVQFDRLPYPCFKCGSILQTVNQCSIFPGKVTVAQAESLPYGTFLHAPFVRISNLVCYFISYIIVLLMILRL